MRFGIIRNGLLSKKIKIQRRNDREMMVLIRVILGGLFSARVGGWWVLPPLIGGRSFVDNRGIQVEQLHARYIPD